MSSKFPTQSTFSLSQLASRWSVTPDQVRGAVVDGLLKPSYAAIDALEVPQWAIDNSSLDASIVASGSKTYESVEPKSREQNAPPFGEEGGIAYLEVPATDYEVSDTGIARIYRPAAFLYLQMPKRKAAFDCEFNVGCTTRDPETPSIQESVLDQEWYYLPAKFSMRDVEAICFFTQQEVHQFELKHMNASQAFEPGTKDLSSREREALLSIIGALVDLCVSSEGSGQKSHPATPNQAKLVELLASSYDGCAGLSESNLKKKFADARKAVDRATNRV